MNETFREMCNIVTSWYIYDCTEVEQMLFKNSSANDLHAYHHSLGTKIRNYFKLWERNWTPLMYDMCDHSPDHPDNLSMRIIQSVWNDLQD